MGAAAYCIVVAVSRLSLGVHWLMDVTTGGLLGVLVLEFLLSIGFLIKRSVNISSSSPFLAKISQNDFWNYRLLAIRIFVKELLPAWPVLHHEDLGNHYRLLYIFKRMFGLLHRLYLLAFFKLHIQMIKQPFISELVQ